MGQPGLRVEASEELRTAYWSSIQNSLRKDPSFTWNEKGVWIVLADWARTCASVHLSKKRIGDEAGIKSRTVVTEALTKLEQAGLIRRVANSGRTNDYEVFPHEPGRNPADHPAAIRPTTRPESGRYTETGIQKQTSPSPDGDPLDLSSTKQPFRSVIDVIKEEFSKASGCKYSFTKADLAILKKIWESVDDLADLARVFASAAFLRGTDPWWQSRWSVKHVYGNLSMLKNAKRGSSAGDQDDRALESARTTLLLETRRGGLAESDARRILRAAGRDEDVPFLRKLAACLAAPDWSQRLLQRPAETFQAAVERCAQGSAPPGDRGDAAPSEDLAAFFA